MMCGPPWWILKEVTPAGPEKDMGGWTAIQFTEEQQAKYGCNAEGDVTDQATHDSAFENEMVRHSGYISGGGDIHTEEMTLEDAKKKAAELPACCGFCFQGDESAGPVSVYFKDKFDNTESSEWTSYSFPDPICGELVCGEPEPFCGGDMGGMVCGGTGEEADAAIEVQAICEALKDDIQKAAQAKGWNGVITSLKAMKSKQQVVAGTNYFVKAQINDGDWFHLRIFEPLPHTGEAPSLSDIQIASSDSALEYF